MSQFFTLPTKIGQGLISNAIAYNEPLTIATMAIGDGKLPSPDASVTRLVNEVRRGPINQITPDPDNPNWIIAEQVLPPDVGGWTIREVGLYDTDGNLVAYGNYPETYKPQLSEGSSRTQTIRFVMETTDTSAVTLKIDPAVVMASRKYVDDQLDAHAKSRNHPAADTKNSGMMRFATLAESKKGEESKAAQTPAGGKAQLDDRIADQETVNTGENDKKFVTPLKLRQWIKQATESVSGLLKIATQEQVDEVTDDTAAVTPKKLAFGILYSSKSNGYLQLPKWMGSFLFQWGYINTGAITSITWPVAFEIGVFGYAGIGADNEGITGAHCMYQPTQTGARVNNTRALRWIAVGR